MYQVETLMNPPERQFDPNDRKYLCCYGCHVMTGAKILAYIYIIVFILEALYVSSSMSLVIILLAIVVLSLFWYGLVKEREQFLIPMLVFLVLHIIGLTAFLIKINLEMIFPSNRKSSGIGTLVFAILTIVLVSIVPQVWFVVIVKNAYDYIKHQRFISANNVAILHETTIEVPVIVTKEDSEPEANDSD